MKRGAERQISKDEDDEEDDDIEEYGEGFKKADESVIASRKIRALPRRSMATPTTPLTNGASSSETPTSKPASGFAGFGVTASNSTSFSFTPPAASAFSTAPSQSTPFGTSKSTDIFSSGSATVSPSASNATKAFASVLSSPTSQPTPPLAPPPSAAPVKPSSEAEDAALKYYISLRGLNVSFLSAVNEAVEEDPFIDVTLIMERYRTLRTGMQKEFDEKTRPAPVAAPPSMPKPPGSGSFTFAASTPSASKAGGGSGGFVPKIDSSNPSASSLPFPFATTPSATSTFGKAIDSKPSSETKPQSAFGSNGFASASGATTGTLAFGAAPSSTTTSAFGSSSTKTSSAPTPFFGVPKPDTSTGSTTASLFGFTNDKDKPSAPATFGTNSGNVFGSASSPFGASPSGAFGAGSTSVFGSGSKPIVSAFGTASKTGATVFGTTSGTPPNPFGFSSGSSATPSTPTPAPFGSGIGKPTGTGSIGNPVGFVFGSPTKTGEATGAERPTPLVFPASGSESAPVVNSASASREGTSDEDAVPSQGGGEGDDASKMLGKNPNDEEGEGEEGEETVHAIKLKAYKMTKKDENGNGGGWNELGHGVLRLKKHKTTDSRRVLMRNSSTGKININFGINASLKPSLTKKSITFVGHEDGSPQSYCVRLQTEAQAKALSDALTREIDFVKAKTGD